MLFFSKNIGLSVGVGYENHEIVRGHTTTNLDVQEINIALRTKFKVSTNLSVFFHPGLVAQRLNGYGCTTGGSCKQNISHSLFKLIFGVRYDYKRAYSSLFFVSKSSHLDTFYFGAPSFYGLGLSIGYTF